MEGPKGAGYLLLDLHHPDILLALVVGKGHAGIMKEGKHGALMLLKSEQEILSLCVLAPSRPGPWRQMGQGVFGEARVQGSPILSEPSGLLGQGHGSGPDPVSSNGAVHSDEQVQHGLGPLLAQDLVKEGELPQEMGVAEAVQAFQFEVGAQAVVDKPACESGENGEMADGLGAAFAVDAVPGKKFGAGDMKPMGLAGYAQPGFIRMSDGRLSDEVGHPGLEFGQSEICGGDRGLSRGLADEPAKKVGAHLAYALERYELLASQVDQPGVEAGAVLCGRVDAGWEGSRDFAPGSRAELDLCTMLDDDELLRGQFEDLPDFVAKQGLVTKVGSAAAGTKYERVSEDAVGLGLRRQGGPRMPLLPPRIASAGLAQALGVGLGVAVGGRRAVAVGAVLGEPGLESLDAVLEVDEHIDEAARLSPDYGLQLLTGPVGRAFHESPGPGDRDGCP